MIFGGGDILAQVKKDSVSNDSTMLKLIEQQMQEAQQKEQQNNPQPQTNIRVPYAQTRSGLNFNPQIGVIGDFRSSYISEGSRNLDAYLKETELSFKATVDPYVRADFYVSLSRDPVTGAYGVEVEEGYLTTLSLPAQLQLKVGKFKQSVGRLNTIHPHALPFIDTPNAYENYFGEEGLNDEGASLSWLLPNTKFYQELIVEATAGFTEAPSFERSSKNRFIYLAHLKNFFTMGENSTIELGLTGISGPNSYNDITNIGAADITYKWKPVKFNTYHSFTWQSEIFYGHISQPGSPAFKSFGLYSYAQYQVAKRWFLTGRYDYAQMPENNSSRQNAGSLVMGWYATEFQKIEVEGKYTFDNTQPDYAQAWLRWIFVIGAHGAHKY